MRYTVQHNYTAYRDGQLFGPWEEGTEVELEETDAEWVNRDSTDTLKPVDQADAPDPEPAEESAAEEGTEVELEETDATPKPRTRGKR